MELLDDRFYSVILRSFRKRLTVFLVLCAAFAAVYVYSFSFDRPWVPMLAGVCGVLICVLFYYLAVFDLAKLNKLMKNLHTGITQTDRYCLKAYDDDTEHDGVELKRLLCTAKDEESGQEYDRVLYLVKAAHLPSLLPGHEFNAVTSQNIILSLELI